MFPIKRNADEALKDAPSVRKLLVFDHLGLPMELHPTRDVLMDGYLQRLPDDRPSEEMDSEDLALMIYTSGTTGKPKGAVHTHGGCLAQMCKELGYNFDVKEDDVFFWLTDIGWMMGPWMIIGVMNLLGSTGEP